ISIYVDAARRRSTPAPKPPAPPGATRRRSRPGKSRDASNVARALAAHQLGDLRRTVAVLCRFAAGFELVGQRAERDISVSAAADLLRALVREESRRFGELGLN